MSLAAAKYFRTIEGDRYVVTWALGHLVTLADPEGYDKKYKEWNLDVLPMIRRNGSWW